MNRLDDAGAAELAALLRRIQQISREYPSQDSPARGISFASIRVAADSIATLADDALGAPLADDIRRATNDIHAAVDDLSDRFGSDEAGRCRACGSALARVDLRGGEALAYCTTCPTAMLDAVREIADLSGADTL